MLAVLTPADMAGADRRTIAGGTPEAVLVERAGTAVAWNVRALLGGCYGTRAVVVAGKGNNGADGLVAGRVLGGWGTRVSAFVLDAPVDRDAFDRALSAADVAIDAMFGTGLSRVLDGDAAWVAQRLDASACPVVSVDIPSGVDGQTGVARGPAVHAAQTVTFAAPKTGLYFEPGHSLAGAVFVVDIGVDLGPDGLPSPPVRVLERGDVAGLLPARDPAAHKWTAAAMVVGGSGGMTGAPMLASTAAMRAGAGMVWCALPGEDAARRAAGGEVITRALPTDEQGGVAGGAASVVLDALARFRALAVGPGLGRGPSVAGLVHDLLANAACPVVLDADGLNALDGDVSCVADRAARGASTVLTPHDGEYERLAGEAVGDDRIAAACGLADRCGAVVLLKGPCTVVASPGGPVALNPTGSAALATAGTGDVLTGVVAAFLARGLDGFGAAATGAWIHGAAALAVAGASDVGLVAGDVVTAIAPTLLALEENVVLRAREN